MGIAQSMGIEASETKKSKAFDSRLDIISEDEGRRIKVIVLGLPGSGKSTFIKQMRIQELKKPYNTAKRKTFIPAVHALIIRSMQMLIAKASELGFGSPHPVLSQVVLAAAPWEPLTPDVANVISKLWLTDETVRMTYAARSLFPWEDSASYFFDKAISCADVAWIPTVEDVLRAPTTRQGIVEETVIADNGELVFIDVAAQRNDKKKWIHSFSGVTAVIFVASLADYERLSDGDPTVCRLMEGLTLYAEMVNSRWFDSALFFLILNKADLFEQQIKYVDLRHEMRAPLPGAPGFGRDEVTIAMESAARLGGLLSARSGLTMASARSGDSIASGKNRLVRITSPEQLPSRFLDYTGGRFYFQALQYITGRFLELSRRTGDRQVAYHVTNATDMQSMRRITQSIRDAIIQHYMETGAAARSVQGMGLQEENSAQAGAGTGAAGAGGRGEEQAQGKEQAGQAQGTKG